MSGNANGNFERRNSSSGSKLILLALPSETVLEPIRQATRDLAQRHGLKGRPRPDDVLHVSIAGFGPYSMLPLTQVNALRHILSELEFCEFDISFDRAASFNGSYGKPVVLYSENGNQELVKLEVAARKLLEPCFGKPTRKAYNPHMALLYDGKKIVAEEIKPISWRVHELVLVESPQGQTEYIPICKFPCRQLH